jgi:hypothetical protein
MEAYPGACARVVVQGREKAEANDNEGKGDVDNGLKKTKLSGQYATDHHGWEERKEGRKEHDAGALDGRAEDALEVDWRKCNTHKAMTLDKREEEDYSGNGMSKEVYGHHGVPGRNGCCLGV